MYRGEGGYGPGTPPHGGARPSPTPSPRTGVGSFVHSVFGRTSNNTSNGTGTGTYMADNTTSPGGAQGGTQGGGIGATATGAVTTNTNVGPAPFPQGGPQNPHIPNIDPATGAQATQTAANTRVPPATTETHRVWLPPGFRMPFLITIATMTSAVQATLDRAMPHVIVLQSKKRHEYPIYVPATATTKANMKFRSWDRLYGLYVYGQLYSGVSRGELARESVQKFSGSPELQKSFLTLSDEVINYEGQAGDGSGVPPNDSRRGGLDLLYEMLCDRFKDEDYETEIDDIVAFEAFKRKPHQSMRTFVIDFNTLYAIANSEGKIAHKPSYMTHLLFLKGNIKDFEQSLVMSQVGHNRDRFEEIKLILRKTLKDHRTDSQGGVYYHDGDDDEWEKWYEYGGDATYLAWATTDGKMYDGKQQQAATTSNVTGYGGSTSSGAGVYTYNDMQAAIAQALAPASAYPGTHAPVMAAPHGAHAPTPIIVNTPPAYPPISATPDVNAINAAYWQGIAEAYQNSTDSYDTWYDAEENWNWEEEWWPTDDSEWYGASETETYTAQGGLSEIYYDCWHEDTASPLEYISDPTYYQSSIDVYYDLDTDWCWNDTYGAFWVDDEGGIHFHDDETTEWHECYEGVPDTDKGPAYLAGFRPQQGKGKGRGDRHFAGWKRGRYPFKPRWMPFQSSGKGWHPKGKSKGFTLNKGFGGNGKRKGKGKFDGGKGKGKFMFKGKGKAKGKGKGQCLKCGQHGHWAAECPLNKGKGKVIKGQFSKGKFDGKGDMGMKGKHKGAQRAFCNICKFSLHWTDQCPTLASNQSAGTGYSLYGGNGWSSSSGGCGTQATFMNNIPTFSYPAVPSTYSEQPYYSAPVFMNQAPTYHVHAQPTYRPPTPTYHVMPNVSRGPLWTSYMQLLFPLMLFNLIMLGSTQIMDSSAVNPEPYIFPWYDSFNAPLRESIDKAPHNFNYYYSDLAVDSLSNLADSSHQRAHDNLAHSCQQHDNTILGWLFTSCTRRNNDNSANLRGRSARRATPGQLVAPASSLEADSKLDKLKRYLKSNREITAAKLKETSRVLIFAEGDRAWDCKWQTFLQYQGHALLLDTGAAKNLCGSYTLKDYEIDHLIPWNEKVNTAVTTSNFTGINGTPLPANIFADTPIYPGLGFLDCRYKAHVVDKSNLPMLYSCTEMREAGFIIDTNFDCVYVPVDLAMYQTGGSTQFIKMNLHWTGQHYLLPIDVADASVYQVVDIIWPHAGVYSAVPVVDKVTEPLTIKYSHSKVLTKKDWSSLADSVSNATGRVVHFDVSGILITGSDKSTGSKSASDLVTGSETVGIREGQTDKQSKAKFVRDSAQTLDETYKTSKSSASSNDDSVLSRLASSVTSSSTYNGERLRWDRPPESEIDVWKRIKVPNEDTTVSSVRTKYFQRESKRPVGSPPAISKEYLDISIWYYWELGSDGTTTAYLEKNNVPCGPIINWSTGWDLENNSHLFALQKYVELKTPKIVHVNIEFSSEVYKSIHNLLTDAQIDLICKRSSNLSNMLIKLAQLQDSNDSDFIYTMLSKCLWWKGEKCAEVRKLSRCLKDFQLVDLCSHGLTDLDTARPLKIRVQHLTSVRLPRSTRTCRGHGKAYHQPLRGVQSNGVRGCDVDGNGVYKYQRKLGKDIHQYLIRKGLMDKIERVKPKEQNSTKVKGNVSVYLQSALQLLSLQGEGIMDCPRCPSLEDIEDTTAELSSNLDDMKYAVESRDIVALSTAITHLQTDVNLTICKMGLQTCFEELYGLHHNYLSTVAQADNETDLTSIKDTYEDNVNTALIECGCADLIEDPALIAHTLESMEILVATTCGGCLDKDGKTPHVNDVTCKRFRRKQLELAGRQRRRTEAAKAVGAAPPPLGRGKRRANARAAAASSSSTIEIPVTPAASSTHLPENSRRRVRGRSRLPNLYRDKYIAVWVLSKSAKPLKDDPEEDLFTDARDTYDLYLETHRDMTGFTPLMTQPNGTETYRDAVRRVLREVNLPFDRPPTYVGNNTVLGLGIRELDIEDFVITFETDTTMGSATGPLGPNPREHEYLFWINENELDGGPEDLGGELCDKFQERKTAAIAKLTQRRPHSAQTADLEPPETPAGPDVAFPAGGILRALRAGGERAMRALNTLHRKFYHASAATMKRILNMAGIPEAVVKEVDTVIAQCRVCRTWERPAIKPMAKAELALEINKRLYADIIHYTMQNATVIYLLHMLDDASRFRMLELLMDRTFAGISEGLLAWISIFGEPEVLAFDQESSVASEEMAVWLESRLIKLDLLPSASGESTASHTAAGIIESNNRVLRKVMHKCETAMIEQGIEPTPKSVMREAHWCLNSVPQHAGIPACCSALGHIPRDPLGVHELTTTAAEDHKSQFLGRMKVRICGMSAAQEGILQARLHRVARAHERKSGVGEDGPVKYECGDEVDVWRDSKSKDLTGWRGPSEVVNDKRQTQGKITVEWQGNTRTVPLSEIRHHNPLAFFAGEGGSVLVRLMRLVDELLSVTCLIGRVPTPTGIIYSQASGQFPELLSSVRAVSGQLHLKADGAILGQGVKRFPGIHQIPGVGLLLMWHTGVLHTMTYQTLRSHWAVDLSKLTPMYQHFSFIFLYKFEVDKIIEDSWKGAETIYRRSHSSTIPYGHSSHTSNGHQNSNDVVIPPYAQTVAPLMPPAVAARPPRYSWTRVSEGVYRRSMGALRLAGTAARTAIRAELGETVGNHIGSTLGGAVGGLLGGSAGATAGAAVGSEVMGRIGESAASSRFTPTMPSIPEGNAQAAANQHRQPCRIHFANETSNDKCEDFTPSEVIESYPLYYHGTTTNKTYLDDLLKDMNKIPNERKAPSMRNLILVAKNVSSHGAALSPEEEHIFHKEVGDAKRKEALSWCEHKVFDTVPSARACIKPQGSRWVLTWRMVTDSVGQVEWTVKARLVVQGFGDKQGDTVITRSPTAARTAQRLLVSTCVLFGLELSSIDISTAFLQGFELEHIETADGEQRKACISPPADFWEHCSQDELDKATRLASDATVSGGWTDLVWNLLKPAYGLKDAPLLWIMALVDYLKKMSLNYTFSSKVHKIQWISSIFDESTFYLRCPVTHKLLAMLTIHVDDLALASTKDIRNQINLQLSSRFGKTKLQLKKFQHTGRDYEQHEDGSVSTSLTTFIDAQELEVIHGKLSEKLGKAGSTSLRSANGSLQYIASERPDVLGKIAVSQENMNDIENQTWATVAKANEIIAEIKENNHSCKLWYPVFPEQPPVKRFLKNFKLTLVTDSAFKNLSSKYSQGAYAILLTNTTNENSVGGVSHVLEFNSRKSRRVVKSTWGAELHAFLFGLERIERMYYWLKEIYQGEVGNPGIARVKHLDPTNFITVQGCVDCKGLYDSLTSPVVGSLTDMSLQLYLMALRESLRIGPLKEMCWIPTDDMLVDSQTKWMDDSLWKPFYKTSFWQPSDALCTRRTNHGKLEKFSKTLIAFLRSFVLEPVPESESVCNEVLALFENNPTSEILYADYLAFAIFDETTE